MLAISLILALVLDSLLGEPRRFHPLVGFGYLAKAIEKLINRHYPSHCLSLVLGACSGLLLVLLPTAGIVILIHYLALVLSPWVKPETSMFVAGIVTLYFAIARQSLREHALAVWTPLEDNKIHAARQYVALMVSRDTQDLDEQGIRKAAIESVLENGSDAIFAPVFWFCVGGLPALIIYRLSNTLDAMWGYKNPRFILFGRFSARLDDVLNWLPARLTALSYILLGNTAQGKRCWQQQAQQLESPNAGVVMTAGAGSLNICLGGKAYYQGVLKEKPEFGGCLRPDNKHIKRSLLLVDKTVCLWVLALIIVEGLKQ